MMEAFICGIRGDFSTKVMLKKYFCKWNLVADLSLDPLVTCKNFSTVVHMVLEPIRDKDRQTHRHTCEFYNTRYTIDIAHILLYVKYSSRESLIIYSSLKDHTFWLWNNKMDGPRHKVIFRERMKNVHSLDILKTLLKRLTFVKCPCNICKVYIQGVWYLD